MGGEIGPRAGGQKPNRPRPKGDANLVTASEEVRVFPQGEDPPTKDLCILLVSQVLLTNPKCFVGSPALSGLGLRSLKDDKPSFYFPALAPPAFCSTIHAVTR